MNIETIEIILRKYIYNKERSFSSYDESYVNFIINNLQIYNDEFVLDCHGLRKEELLYFLVFIDSLKLKMKLILITGVGNNSKKPQYMDYLSKKLWLSPLKEVIMNYYRKTSRGYFVKDNYSSMEIRLYWGYK